MADNDAAFASWDERTHRLLDLGEPLVLTALYFYSVVSWVWGLVFGVVALARCKLDANKRVGKICLILAAVNIVIVGCLVALYIIGIIFAVAAASLATSSAGG